MSEHEYPFEEVHAYREWTLQGELTNFLGQVWCSNASEHESPCERCGAVL